MGGARALTEQQVQTGQALRRLQDEVYAQWLTARLQAMAALNAWERDR